MAKNFLFNNVSTNSLLLHQAEAPLDVSTIISTPGTYNAHVVSEPAVNPIVIPEMTSPESDGTLYESILALSDPSKTGRQSTNALTPIDLNNVPEGTWWRSDNDHFYVQGDNLTFTDYDFRGLHVEVEGNNVTFDNCIFGYADGEAGGTGLYYFMPASSASNILVTDCTMDAGGWKSSRRSVVVFGGMAPDGADNTTFRRVRVVNVASDYIKPGGQGTLFDQCYFGQPSNVPPQATYFDSSKTYQSGDFVLFPVGGGSYRLYEAKEASNGSSRTIPAGEEPTGNTLANEYWKNHDKHLDGFQVPSFKDMTIRDTLIEMPAEDSSGNLQAIGVTNALRFAPNTNRQRLYDNLFISGMIIKAPYGGHNPTSFATNIRDWDNDDRIANPNQSPITYKDDTSSSERFCRYKGAYWRILEGRSDNSGTPPDENPNFRPERDILMPGPLRVEHVWVSRGKNGKEGVFSGGSPFPVSSSTLIDPTKEPIAMGSRGTMEVNTVKPEPAFGSNRLATDIKVDDVYGPAEEFIVTPNQFYTVFYNNNSMSALPLYINGVPSGAIGEDGTLYEVDGKGVSVTDLNDGSYRVAVYDHNGDSMVGSLHVIAGSANVTTQDATNPTGGPKWGFIDNQAPSLSDFSMTPSTSSIDWSINTDEGNGTLYTVLVDNTKPAPSNDDIMNGVDGAGDTAKEFSSHVIESSGVVSGTYGSTVGLPEASEYTAYACHQDKALNVSSVKSIDAWTTSSEAIAIVGNSALDFPTLKASGVVPSTDNAQVTMLARILVPKDTDYNQAHPIIESHGREFRMILDLRGDNDYRRVEGSAEEGGSNAVFMYGQAPHGTIGYVPATFMVSIVIDNGGDAIMDIYKNGTRIDRQIQGSGNPGWSSRDLILDIPSMVGFGISDFAVWSKYTLNGTEPDDSFLMAPRITGGADAFNNPPSPWTFSGRPFV